jgi:hypothetical protein
MKTLLFILFTSISYLNFAQFTTESQVVSYMSGKEFYNESYGMKVGYEFIPKFNSYGIVCVNKNSEKFYYINCSVRPYGSSADINGMSSDGGGNFGFRVYSGKISVQGVDFYQVGRASQSTSSSVSNTTQKPTLARYFDQSDEAKSTSNPQKEMLIHLKPTTTEGIKYFQDWMDEKHPGWVNGKSLKKGTGYGSWGPSTQKAFDQFGLEYNGY